MRSEPTGPIQAVILGTDAVLAARPAEPIQLARACQRAGFDFVAPVSWGEELLATRIADVVDEHRPATLVVAHCPFVAESLRARPPRAAAIASVSPPVATARYIRAALPSHLVHITYVGACPGASAPDIDHRMLPDVLIAWLIEAGIDVQTQPCHLDGLLPPDRARHASMPGASPGPAGCPRITGPSRWRPLRQPWTPSPPWVSTRPSSSTSDPRVAARARGTAPGRRAWIRHVRRRPWSPRSPSSSPTAG